MKNPVVIKISSVFVNLICGFIVVNIILYFQEWFGSGDVYSYLFWTIPIAIAVAIFGKPILNLFPVKNHLL